MMALYGLRRSGLDWGNEVRTEVMHVLKYHWVGEVGETSVFIRELVLVVVATGDFAVAGPPEDTTAAYNEPDGLLGFSKKSKEARSDGNFAGPIRQTLPSKPNMNVFRTHQKPHVEHLIKEYEGGHGIVLTPILTPTKQRRDDRDRALAPLPGDYEKRGPEQTGKLWWPV